MYELYITSVSEVLDAHVDGTGHAQHPIWAAVDFLKFASQTGLELGVMKVYECAFIQGKGCPTESDETVPAPK